MPSIFTRARTTSTKNKGPLPPDATQQNGAGAPFAVDEFGRVSSRSSAAPPATPAKDRDRRVQTVADRRRVNTNSTANLHDPEVVQDGFLPTNTMPLDNPAERLEEYGYLGHAVHVVLSLEDVLRLVEVIERELLQRGGLSLKDILEPGLTILQL